MTKRKRPRRSGPTAPELEQGNAFGVRAPDWTEPDIAGHEFADPFEGSSVAVAQHLDAYLPEDVAEQLAQATPLLMLNASPLYYAVGEGAVSMVLTAATNDVVALLRHVNHLDGRSAAHSARTLFEHAVTIFDLYEAGGPNTPQRYEAHQNMTRRYVSQSRWWLTLLPGKQRRREEVRLDRMRREADAALASTPFMDNEFRRQWHKGNVFGRATRHGLASGYDGYRILSAVIHGSAGGLGGVMRQIDGAHVHRVGMDLDLAAMAYAEGLWSWREFATKLYKETGRDEASVLGRVADDLLTCLPEVRTTLAAIDKRLWPKIAPARPIAMAAVYGQGRKVRWYLRDDQTGSAIRAHPPKEDLPGLDTVLEQAKTYDQAAFGGRPLTALFEGVALTPVPGAKPIPLTQIAFPPGHPAILSHPRPIRG